jgi:hypothetical protein
MVFSRYSFVLALFLAAGATLLYARSLHATESDTADQSPTSQPAPVSGSDIVQPSETHPPKSPLKLATIDYQDAGDKPGKLTVAGVALPGKELALFLDDKSVANLMPDESGNWSFEGDVKLGDGRHTLRADQYDTDTNMLAARAMVTFEQAKQPTQDAAPMEPPKADTP